MLPSSSWVAWRVMVMRVLSGSPSCPVCICKIVQSVTIHFEVITISMLISVLFRKQSSYSFQYHSAAIVCFQTFLLVWGHRFFAWKPPHLSLLSLDIIIALQKRRWRDCQLLASSHDCLVMRLKEDFENFNEPFATWLCLRQAAGGWWWCGRGYEYTAARHWRWC